MKMRFAVLLFIAFIFLFAVGCKNDVFPQTANLWKDCVCGFDFNVEAGSESAMQPLFGLSGSGVFISEEGQIFIGGSEAEGFLFKTKSVQRDLTLISNANGSSVSVWFYCMEGKYLLRLSNENGIVWLSRTV